MSEARDRLAAMAATGTCPQCHNKFPVQPDGTVTKHGPCDMPAWFDQMGYHAQRGARKVLLASASETVPSRSEEKAAKARSRAQKRVGENERHNATAKQIRDTHGGPPTRPLSQDPSVIGAWERASLALRIDTDWNKYGFTKKQQSQWLGAGVPYYYAQLAFICSDVRRVPDFVLVPGMLSMKLSDGTILEALLGGADSSQLEVMISRQLRRELNDSPDAWRSSVHSTEIRPTLGNIAAQEIRHRLHSPAGVPPLYDHLLNWLSLHGPIMSHRLRLRNQAVRHLNGSDFEPGARLVSFARGLGITQAGKEMLALAESLKSLTANATDLQAMNILTANTQSRFFYFVDEEATSTVSVRTESNPQPLDLDATRLPSATGFVWFNSKSNAAGTDTSSFLAWQVDEHDVHITISAAADMMKDLESTTAGAGNPSRQTATIPLTGGLVVGPDSSTVVAFFAAFLDVMEMVSMTGVAAPPAARVPGVGVVRPPAAVTILQTRPRNTWPTVPTTPVLRTHQWTVRGHWRNQWRPSTQDHTRLWIDTHTAGPEGTPLIDRERVRVISGGDPKQQM
jgi:hypothetical protein